METQGRQVVIGWWWRAVVRVLAPAREREEILADLAEEAGQLSATQDRATASRFIRAQVLHSSGPWLRRRCHEVTTQSHRMFMMIFRGLWSDVTVAARRLRQSPGFTVLAVLTLAVGIGSVSTVYSLAHAMWLKPLPWTEPDRLVTVVARHKASGSSASLTAAELDAHRRDSRMLSAVAGFMYGAAIGRVGDEPVRIASYYVSPNLFSVLGTRPTRGRDFRDDDAGRPVVMLSHTMWTQRFGGDEGVVGKSLTLAEGSHEIIGVMPKGFEFPRVLKADVWVPAPLTVGGTQRIHQAIARLAPGVTLEAASAEAAARIEGLSHETVSTTDGWTAALIPAGVTASSAGRLAFRVLLGLVCLFLIVASTNLAGLLLARNARRRPELAVCLSLGASRWQLGRSLMVESVLLAAAGCSVGVLVSAFGAGALASLMPRYTPGADQVELSLPVLVVSVSVALLAGMLIGLLPALTLRSMKASEALAGFRGVARGTSRTQAVIVVAEIAFAVILLVGATAMVRAFADAVDRDRGYQPRGLQALNVSLPFTDESYEDTAVRARVFSEMIARVEAVPGVQMASATTGFPGSALGILGAVPITLPESGTQVMGALHAATVDYFATLGVPIRAGRGFVETDTSASSGVIVVNEELAAQFPGGNPVGRQLQVSVFGQPARPFDIVGVAGNIKLGNRAGPRVFVPLAQVSPYWIDLVFRADGNRAVMQDVRRTLRTMNPNLLLENESSFQTIILGSLALERTQSALAGLVGVLSVTVAGIGLYALMTFMAAQRRREFGIRLALGSQPQQLFGTAMSGAMRLVVAGLVVGIGGAALLIRVVGSQVFGLNAAGAGHYVVASTIVVLVAAAAAWLPARRMMRVDPLTALKTD
jgi:putative ABC transport system permease protein